MRRFPGLPFILMAAFALSSWPVRGQDGGAAAQPPAVGHTAAVERWNVTVGKSLVLDSALPIQRLSVADEKIADAVAISPREVLINGKTAGETSLVVWQNNGARLLYDLDVHASDRKLQAIREQIAREYPGESIDVSVDNDAVFVRGVVQDTVAAQRVTAMAGTLGKVVNLLRVVVPRGEPQILVKVRFANVDRAATTTLGADFASGAFNQSTALGVDGVISPDGAKTISLSEAVNLFLFRKDLNLGAAITALESKNLLEILAEPTVPAINGKQASFLAGGEFPFPMVQPSTSGATLSLAWREYGVRLNFLPTITPNGSIRLQVMPEVSSLDYTHAVTVQGFTVPGLATRKVQTEIELESGQSFVIAGLLDKQTTENLAKVPGIGSLPIIGKLFQSKNVSRTDSELLVIVTPEIVTPIESGQRLPELTFPKSFMETTSKDELRQPGLEQTGGAAPPPPPPTMRVEELLQEQRRLQPNTPGPPATAPAAANDSAQSNGATADQSGMDQILDALKKLQLQAAPVAAGSPAPGGTGK